MPKVQIWGFECSRCGYTWVPRDENKHPELCPKCKSPYWDRPRRSEVQPEHSVTCRWKAHELDGKSVDYEIVRKKAQKKGFGWLSASDLGDERLQIVVRPADGSEEIKLVQSEADTIKTSHGKYRFNIESRS